MAQESWSEQTKKLLKIADAARERLNEMARKARLKLIDDKSVRDTGTDNTYTRSLAAAPIR